MWNLIKLFEILFFHLMNAPKLQIYHLLYFSMVKYKFVAISLCFKWGARNITRTYTLWNVICGMKLTGLASHMPRHRSFSLLIKWQTAGPVLNKFYWKLCRIQSMPTKLEWDRENSVNFLEIYDSHTHTHTSGAREREKMKWKRICCQNQRHFLHKMHWILSIILFASI